MNHFRSMNKHHGYNICPNAGNHLGLKYSEESCKRIGDSKRGTKHSDETKAKMAASQKSRSNLYGRIVSKRTREKIRNTLRGRTHSEEARKNLLAAMSDPIVRAKMSEASRGRKWSESHRKAFQRSLENPESIIRRRTAGSILGKKFGQLLVIEALPSRRIGDRKRRRVICKCDCGNIVEKNLEYLRYKSPPCGHSCGCRREL